jgi:hypothetical protein
MTYTPPPKVTVRVEFGANVYTLNSSTELHRTSPEDVGRAVEGLLETLKMQAVTERGWALSTGE